MIGVHRPVEKVHPLHAHRGHNGLDPPAISALREIGNALDDRVFHGHFQNVYPTCTWMLALTPGLRSPSEADEICTAFTPRSIDRFDAQEIVHADAALRREIPHRCAAGSAVRNKHVRRKLVGRVNQAAGGLKPRLNSPRMGEEVPAKNDRREAEARVGSATNGLRRTPDRHSR